MSKSVLPASSSRSFALLTALRQGPGTFYQICERAGFDIEDSALEEALRKLFDHLIGGNVCLSKITYSLTDEARLALGDAPPAKYVGQVAGPVYRGAIGHTTVRIARRAPGAHA